MSCIYKVSLPHKIYNMRGGQGKWEVGDEGAGGGGEAAGGGRRGAGRGRGEKIGKKRGREKEENLCACKVCTAQRREGPTTGQEGGGKGVGGGETYPPPGPCPSPHLCKYVIGLHGHSL